MDQPETLTAAVEAPFDLQGALDMLGQYMAKAEPYKARVAQIKAAAEAEATPFKEELMAIDGEVVRIRAAIDLHMSANGIRTVDGDTVQVQRARTVKPTITNIDIALANLADLDRLSEVQYLATDERKVLEIAKSLPNGLDGVVNVETFTLKVVKR